MPATIKTTAVTLTSTKAVVLGCAAGTQVAVTDLLLENTGAVASVASLFFYSAALGTEVPLPAPPAALVAYVGVYRHPGKIFLQPGDEIRAINDNAASVNAVVSYAITTAVVAPASGFLPRGVYAAAATYAINDVVSFNGIAYVSATVGNKGNQPDTTPAQWTVLGSRGPTGATGVGGSNSTSQSFAIRADAVAATIASTVQQISLQGYYVLGDHTENAHYIRTAQAPTTHDWYFTSADGAIWVFNGVRADVRMAGAKGDFNPTGASGNGTDDTAALKRAFNYSQKTGFFGTPGPASSFNMHGIVFWLPPGIYKHSGAIGTPGLNGQVGQMLIHGVSRAASMLYNVGTGFQFEGLQANHVDLFGFSARGGDGFLTLSQTAGQSVRMHNVSWCEFADYNIVAIANNTIDGPYWKVQFCKFNPAATIFNANGAVNGGGQYVNDQSKYGCLAFSGLVDQHEISNNEFIWYNSAIKMEAGNNAKVRNNFFAGAMVPSGHDIWIFPRNPQSDPNWGHGFTSEHNKYSFEGVSNMGGGPRVRFARELPADVSANKPNWLRQYDMTAETVNFIAGYRSVGDIYYNNDYQTTYGVMITALNLGALEILDPVFIGTPCLMFVQYVAGAGLPRGPWVRQNYFRLTNWPASESRGLAATNYSQPVVITNRPELWFVDDPMGVAQGSSQMLAQAQGMDDPSYVLRNFFNVATGGAGSDKSEVAVTDPWGGATATEVTFNTNVATWLTSGWVAHAAGAPGFIEVLVKAASSRSLAQINVWLRNNPGGGGEIEVSRSVQLTSRWQLVRIPWTPFTDAGSYALTIQPGRGFVSGTTDKVQLCNPRTYEARQPVNHEGIKTGSMAWNGPHWITTGGIHIWISTSTTKLRIKVGAPTSDTDGAAVT